MRGGKRKLQHERKQIPNSLLLEHIKSTQPPLNYWFRKKGKKGVSRKKKKEKVLSEQVRVGVVVVLLAVVHGEGLGKRGGGGEGEET